MPEFEEVWPSAAHGVEYRRDISPNPPYLRGCSLRDGQFLPDGACKFESRVVSERADAWTDFCDHPENGVHAGRPVSVVEGRVRILPERYVAARANKPIIGPVVAVPGEVAHGASRPVSTPHKSEVFRLGWEVDISTRDGEIRQAPLLDPGLL